MQPEPQNEKIEPQAAGIAPNCPAKPEQDETAPE
jgi:hypothetical protein